MVLFMLMLCHVCDPPVTHVRTIAICVFVLDVLCHVCDAHVSLACAPCACSQQLVAQATRPALIMATRVSGTRDENFYDELIARHVLAPPKLKALSWRRMEPAAVAAAWSGLLTDVASSGVKLHIATFSSRLDNYHGACRTHRLFAEAMQKTLSHCRSKCKGARIQNYSDLGSRQPSWRRRRARKSADRERVCHPAQEVRAMRSRTSLTPMRRRRSHARPVLQRGLVSMRSWLSIMRPMPHRVPAAAGSWLQLSVRAHLQGSLLRIQMWKMFLLTYNFISHAQGLC